MLVLGHVKELKALAISKDTARANSPPLSPASDPRDGHSLDRIDRCTARSEPKLIMGKVRTHLVQVASDPIHQYFFHHLSYLTDKTYWPEDDGDSLLPGLVSRTKVTFFQISGNLPFFKHLLNKLIILSVRKLLTVARIFPGIPSGPGAVSRFAILFTACLLSLLQWHMILGV